MMNDNSGRIVDDAAAVEVCVKDDVREGIKSWWREKKKHVGVIWRPHSQKRQRYGETERGRFRSELSFRPLAALLWASGYTSVMN